MSGGSFDYLYIKDAHRVVDSESDVQQMYDWLKDHGYADAMLHTGLVLQAIQLLDQRIDRMRDVWQAVEWCCSSDWGEDQVKEAIDKWRDSLLASTPESPEGPPS